MSSYSSEIVKVTLDTYNSLKPKAPPNSYTVLASICDVREPSNLIALSIGTQACLRAYPDDIQDCHAESLLKRAFKRYLINLFLEVNISNYGNTENKKKQLSALVPKELVLFISQFPCGLIRRFQGSELIDESTGEPIKRKPGRGLEKDGKYLYVEKDPCVDKLKRLVRDGFQGRDIHRLTGVKSIIRKIIIGDCESDDTSSNEMNVRQLLNYLACDHEEVQIELAQGTRQDDLLYSCDKIPNPISMVCWSTGKSNKPVGLQHIPHMGSSVRSELLVDGRKQGLTKSQCVSHLDRFKLAVADHCLRRDLALVARQI